MTAGNLPRAGRREWIGLAVIALPCVLYSMDLTVLNLALPALSADLEPSSSQLLWIVDIYGFLVAGLLITMGTSEFRRGARHRDPRQHRNRRVSWRHGRGGPGRRPGRGDLGGALAVAGRLPERLGAELLATAREAFVQALELTTAISGALVLTTAVVAVVVMRRFSPGDEPRPKPDFLCPVAPAP